MSPQRSSNWSSYMDGPMLLLEFFPFLNGKMRLVEYTSQRPDRDFMLFRNDHSVDELP